MSDADNGGPAFPSNSGRMVFENGVPRQIGGEGMSLRDWFATHATEDDIAEYMEFNFDWNAPILEFARPKYSSEQARYRYADAMLAARKGGAE